MALRWITTLDHKALRSITSLDGKTGCKWARECINIGECTELTWTLLHTLYGNTLPMVTHSLWTFSRIILLLFDSKVQNQFSSQTVSGCMNSGFGCQCPPSLQYVTWLKVPSMYCHLACIGGYCVLSVFVTNNLTELSVFGLSKWSNPVLTQPSGYCNAQEMNVLILSDICETIHTASHIS